MGERNDMVNIVGVVATYKDKQYKSVATNGCCKGCSFTDGSGGCISPEEIDEATDHSCDGIIWVELQRSHELCE